MKFEEARSQRGVARALAVALASVLLASCTSSSDPDMLFGFSTASLTAETSAASGFAGPTVNSAATQEGAVGEFIVEEGDPQLPEAVAAAPVQRPVSAAEAALQATAPAQTTQQTIAAAGHASQPELPIAHQSTAAIEGNEEHVAADQDSAPVPTSSPENAAQAAAAVTASEPPKRGFLSSFFGVRSARAAATQQTIQPLIDVDKADEEEAEPLVQLASTGEAAKPLVDPAAFSDGNALPGVREEGLFEITRRSGLDDDSDIDLHEGDELYQVASAAGLARLAPNGLIKQTEHVDIGCLKPSLVRVLKTIERHYGKKIVVTSGYRDPARNRRARGARNSLHMYCAAADVQVPGVGKWELAKFVRSMPGRGGVGTYCHTNSVHVDVGPERDWNWRCRRRK